MDPLLRTSSRLPMRRVLCSSSLQVCSRANPPTIPRSLGLQNSDRIQRRYKGNTAGDGGQARPLEGFYAELLSHPLRKLQPAARTAPTAPPPESLPKTEKEATLQKARVIFGSRLAGPGERRAEKEAQAQNIAGVMVPPKPTEPDNCCMSGCVNCVWDMYRDEMEEWAAKSAEARAAIQAQRESRRGTGSTVAEQGAPTHVATSMDDDGGGSETKWEVDLGASQESLFDDIPVGIREFMKTEKMLKQRHSEEQATAR